MPYHLIMKTLLSLMLFFVIGCATFKPTDQRAVDRANIKSELQDEMSLKADREKLEELRKDIPQETQKKNDELALYLDLMNKGTESPQAVRDRFFYMVQKRRTTFREKVQRLREDFRKDETQRREKNLAAQKSKRDSFLKRKTDAKATREFFAEQERERQRFVADERDRRQSFEAELNAQSKDFDSYMRERQKEFDEQFRLYSKKHYEKPKDKKPATGDEFQQLRDADAKPLGTGD